MIRGLFLRFYRIPRRRAINLGIRQKNVLFYVKNIVMINKYEFRIRIVRPAEDA
jgi:hypothetical protein